ncbi:MAG TPA: ABC transporter ATP-binding protein, partial [Clostridium sp.]|nr:ABC transporter ATP-binding protein [Clostridium sp.]
MSEVLKVINISKIYGNQRVLDNVNMSIEEG